MKFTPAQLLEGYSLQEVFESIKQVDEILAKSFGEDKEAKATALAFLLGRHLKDSKITPGMAFSMVSSSIAVKLQ